MKDRNKELEQFFIKRGPTKPTLQPKSNSKGALKLRRDKLDATQRELDLRKSQLAITSEGSAIGAVKAQMKKRAKEPARLLNGPLDWHLMNNDK